jgi:acyl-CoA thioester hydrolase
MEEFRFSTEVPVRYRDLDAAGHVNNAVYGTYAEQARVAYFEAVVADTLGTGNAALASLSLTFERPVVDATGSVTVGVRTTALGESSLTQSYRLTHDDRRVATAEATVVALDPETGRSRPMPETWRETVRAYEPAL